MTPKEKAAELLKLVKQKDNAFDKQQQKNCAVVVCDEVLGVLRYFIEDNAYREDITRTYWNKVKNEVLKTD